MKINLNEVFTAVNSERYATSEKTIDFGLLYGDLKETLAGMQPRTIGEWQFICLRDFKEGLTDIQKQKICKVYIKMFLGDTDLVKEIPKEHRTIETVNLIARGVWTTSSSKDFLAGFKCLDKRDFLKALNAYIEIQDEIIMLRSERDMLTRENELIRDFIADQLAGKLVL